MTEGEKPHVHREKQAIAHGYTFVPCPTCLAREKRLREYEEGLRRANALRRASRLGRAP